MLQNISHMQNICNVPLSCVSRIRGQDAKSGSLPNPASHFAVEFYTYRQPPDLRCIYEECARAAAVIEECSGSLASKPLQALVWFFRIFNAVICALREDRLVVDSIHSLKNFRLRH